MHLDLSCFCTMLLINRSSFRTVAFPFSTSSLPRLSIAISSAASEGEEEEYCSWV